MKKAWELRTWWKMQPEPKVSYSSFYQRVRKWLSREEAIQNITMYVPKRKQELRDYWNNYEWEKVWYTRFLEVYTWCWNKDRAIRKNWITIYERYPKEYSIYQTYNSLKKPKIYVLIRNSLSEQQFAFIFIVWKPQKSGDFQGVTLSKN
jgi:hypothetical protein